MRFHFDLILQFMHILSKHFPKTKILMILRIIRTLIRDQNKSIIHVVLDEPDESCFFIIRPIVTVEIVLKLFEDWFVEDGGQGSIGYDVVKEIIYVLGLGDDVFVLSRL